MTLNGNKGANIDTRNDFLTGVIEGFYGRPWPISTRLAYAPYLASAGLNTCLYAPKADPWLRKNWREHWPLERWAELCQLSAVYKQQGVSWGVGLSPFELYLDYGEPQRRQLREKVRRLQELEAPLLAILFDDMPGNLDALAERQAEIITDVCHWSGGVRVLVCPTYYSFDPVLEKYFGSMCEGYWPRLGRELPEEVDIFWTGNKVCSDAISTADIAAINEQLGRRVILWDNYPVNDGALRSNYLYCEPLGDRDPGLRSLLGGHLCNPMNQGLLSLPALSGLAALYSDKRLSDDWLAETLGEGAWAHLQRDRALFQREGLSGLGPDRAQEMSRVYADLPGDAAREVAGWLRGEYTFDPACLTD